MRQFVNQKLQKGGNLQIRNYKRGQFANQKLQKGAITNQKREINIRKYKFKQIHYYSN